MTPAAAPQKVILQFPRLLLARADQTAVELHTNRSSLIRSAVEEKLERIERARLDEDLRTGYLEMAQQRLADQSVLGDLATEILTREA